MEEGQKADTVLRIVVVTGVISLVCSILVSGVAVTLRPQQETNKKEEILRTVEQVAAWDGKPHSENSVAAVKIVAKTVDLSTGEYIDKPDIAGLSVQEISQNPGFSRKLKKELDRASIRRIPCCMNIFLLENADQSVERIVLPVYGYGLWSTMYAMIALDADGNTIEGIKFYQHKETPGLGGNIDKAAWRSQWRGKDIYAENGDVSFNLVKPVSGKALKGDEVDSLSGASLTSRGVENMVRFWFGDLGYKKFLEKKFHSQ